MTDKELRKLSRLELLELLLESGKENEKLKEKIEKLNAESKTAENIENLSVMTGQVENALRYISSITDTLKKESPEATVTENRNMPKSTDNEIVSKRISDVDIYRRILCFLAKNDSTLNMFPSDIQNDVRERIKGILEKRYSK